MSDPEEPSKEQQANIVIQPEQMAGVWANWARVSHSDYEFTLDFVRLDFTTSPPGGIVVARVSVSPVFITQLIQALESNWQKYAQKSIEKEVNDDPEEGRPES